jgi:hypothetical protein
MEQKQSQKRETMNSPPTYFGGKSRLAPKIISLIPKPLTVQEMNRLLGCNGTEVGALRGVPIFG